jgi:hypothetical protein
VAHLPPYVTSQAATDVPQNAGCGCSHAALVSYLTPISQCTGSTCKNDLDSNQNVLTELTDPDTIFR